MYVAGEGGRLVQGNTKISDHRKEGKIGNGNRIQLSLQLLLSNRMDWAESIERHQGPHDLRGPAGRQSQRCPQGAVLVGLDIIWNGNTTVNSLIIICNTCRSCQCVCYFCGVQLLPFFVATIFADSPGFIGLFLSALYGGSLRLL